VNLAKVGDLQDGPVGLDGISEAGGERHHDPSDRGAQGNHRGRIAGLAALDPGDFGTGGDLVSGRSLQVDEAPRDAAAHHRGPGRDRLDPAKGEEGFLKGRLLGDHGLESEILDSSLIENHGVSRGPTRDGQQEREEKEGERLHLDTVEVARPG
jgi:hypothetical protein